MEYILFTAWLKLLTFEPIQSISESINPYAALTTEELRKLAGK